MASQLLFSLWTPFSAIPCFISLSIPVSVVTKSLFLINWYYYSHILRPISTLMVTLEKGFFTPTDPAQIPSYDPFSTNLTTKYSIFHAPLCNNPQARKYGPDNQSPSSRRIQTSPNSILSHYLKPALFLILISKFFAHFDKKTTIMLISIPTTEVEKLQLSGPTFFVFNANPSNIGIYGISVGGLNTRLFLTTSFLQ